MKTQPEPNPPGEKVPPLLANFLAERRDHITRRWIEAVRRNDSLEAAKGANDVDLADHLPKLFDDLAATLRGESVDGEAKSDAEAHGEHRWQQHYELEEVLEELGIVSRVLLAHGLDAFVDAHPDTPKDQRRGARERIMRFFEDTAAGSVRRYVERNSRRMREQDLLLSEQRRLALDSARMGWWHLDVASGRVDMDQRIRAIFDVDETSDAYTQVLQHIHPDDRERVDAAVQAAIRPIDPVPYAVEYRVVRRDGSLRWVAAKGQTYYEGEGNERRAVGFSGTTLDITDEKAAHETLRESEAKYRSIFTSIDQGYCVIEVIFDPANRPVDYLYLEVNPAFEHQTGLKNVVGRRVLELIPDHEASWFETYGQVVTTGRPTRFEAQANALGRWYDVYASRVEGAGSHQVAVAFTDITAQRASEEALLAERELLRTVFDQAPDDAILVMDAERTLTAWNPAAERIAGWSTAEAIGQSADLIFTPEDRAADAAKQETDTAARAGKAADERWHLRKDGSRFWGSGTMNALHHPDGQVRGYLKVFRDATARHEETETLAFLSRVTDAVMDERDHEQIIEVVERMLGEHLKASRVLFAEGIDGGQQVIVRQAWAPNLPSLVGTHRVADFGEAFVADIKAGRTHVSRDAEVDYPPGMVLESVRAVGAMAGVSVPVLFGGELKMVVVVHQATPRDWTAGEVELIRQIADRMVAEVQRARAERSLRDKEAASRFLADLGEATRQTPDPDAVLGIVVDALREHLAADRCAYVEVEEDQDTITIRYDRANPAGSNRSLVGRYRWSDFGEQMLPTLLAGKTVAVADVATDPRFADAKAAMAAVGVAALVNVPLVKAGKLVAALAVNDLQPRRWTPDEIALIEAVAERSWGEVERSRNVRALAESETRFRQLAESERVARTEAERVSRMKDEFLATLSHELRTPLNAILGWTQVLRGDPANSEDMEAGLATIERNSRAQTQIIEDLLDMSKIISGKIRLNVERLDLAAVVEGAVETARPAATAKGIRLQTIIDPQVSTVSGDLARLQQVFWNLLSNATKFTPKGGHVQVKLDQIDSHLEVSVVDSGEGIAPEFLPEVFDKFRQQDASTTRQHGGLGLGLAIVKQLVELHGGRVRVESAGKGQGATFAVTLPLSVLQPAAAEPESSEPGEHRSTGMDAGSLSIPAELLRLEGIKVLVVDDEPDARALVKRLLEDRKAQVTTAGSAAEAMECFQTERPDVLVSDIGMPGEDGYALIKRIRARGAEHGGNTPAMALTAYARPEDRLKALMAGFQVHAVKPVDATELLALVATLAGRVAEH